MEKGESVQDFVDYRMKNFCDFRVWALYSGMPRLLNVLYTGYMSRSIGFFLKRIIIIYRLFGLVEDIYKF